MRSLWKRIKVLCVVVFITIQTEGAAKQTKLLRQTLINRRNACAVNVSDKVNSKKVSIGDTSRKQRIPSDALASLAEMS